MLISFSSTVEAPQIVEMFPAYYIFNGLFSILLVLHVIWTYFIYKVAYRSLTKSVSDFFFKTWYLSIKIFQGKTQDSRSDSEDSDDDIDDGDIQTNCEDDKEKIDNHVDDQSL